MSAGTAVRMTRLSNKPMTRRRIRELSVRLSLIETEIQRKIMKAFLFDKQTFEIHEMDVTRISDKSVQVADQKKSREKWMYRSNMRHEILLSHGTALRYKANFCRDIVREYKNYIRDMEARIADAEEVLGAIEAIEAIEE